MHAATFMRKITGLSVMVVTLGTTLDYQLGSRARSPGSVAV